MLKKCDLDATNSVLFDGEHFLFNATYSIHSMKDLGNREGKARQYSFIGLMMEAIPVTVVKRYISTLDKFATECYDGELEVSFEDFFDKVIYTGTFKQGEPVKCYRFDCYHNMLYWSNEQWAIQFYTTSTQQYFFSLGSEEKITDKQLEILVLAVLSIFKVTYRNGKFLSLPVTRLKLENSDYPYFKIGD